MRVLQREEATETQLEKPQGEEKVQESRIVSRMWYSNIWIHRQWRKCQTLC
jgi:hypothetical protein